MNQIIKSENEMRAFAAKIAQKAQPGDIYFLKGDLGAGKTTFARGFLQALGHLGKVKSPTYTIVESYQLSKYLIHHFDLYRLKSNQELDDIGFSDYIDGEAICLIEWPNLAMPFVANAKLIAIDIKGNERQVTSMLE